MQGGNAGRGAQEAEISAGMHGMDGPDDSNGRRRGGEDGAAVGRGHGGAGCAAHGTKGAGGHGRRAARLEEELKKKTKK